MPKTSQVSFIRNANFRGGINFPQHEKQVTRESLICDALMPRRLRVDLLRSKEGQSRPVVVPTQHVVAGEKIAEGRDGAVPVFAPLAGRVCSIDPMVVEGIVTSAVMCIDVDANQTAPLSMERMSGPCDREEIITRLMAAGVVEMSPRRAALGPLLERIHSAAGGQESTVVLAAVQSEPYLTADHRLLVEKTAEVIDGLQLLSDGCGKSRRYLVIDDSDEQVIDLVDSLDLKGIEAVAIPVVYPQGHPMLLLNTLFDVKVDPRQDGLDVAALVVNASTAFAIHEAVRMGRPQIKRVITLAGNGVLAPQNKWAYLGTPAASFLAANQLEDGINRMIFGGPLTGVAVTDMTAPLTAATSALLLFRNAPYHQPVACIRCGWCIDQCPVNISPVMLHEYADSPRLIAQGQINRLQPDSCIDCGLCSFVCPSHLPLLESVQRMRATQVAQSD